jgi:hypothetical protein
MLISRYDGEIREDEILITYIERDLEGEPYSTEWLEYDDQGRLAHLTWWGHHYGPVL